MARTSAYKIPPYLDLPLQPTTFQRGFRLPLDTIDKVESLSHRLKCNQTQLFIDLINQETEHMSLIEALTTQPAQPAQPAQHMRHSE